MKEVKLNNGAVYPSIGFGTYELRGSEGIQAIIDALEVGYRLIDTAAVYENEEEVGKAIRACDISREEILVTSKLWRNKLGYENAHKEFDESLSRLGLDYMDLYLIHWPANARNFTDWKRVNSGTWKAFEELQESGKVRAIGVSNFLPEHLEALLASAKIPPVLNQLEFHPGYMQNDAVKYCREHDIVVEAWSPLARGEVLTNDVLIDIAENHGRPVSQICLRWVVQHGMIVIPKSGNTSHIRSNMEIFNFSLTDDEMAQINALPEMGFSGEHPNEW